MAYAEPSDVQAVLARHPAIPVGTAGSMLPDQIAVALVDAQAEIDAKLSGRYTVPFAAGGVPALVHSLTVDIAAYLATLTFRQGKDLTEFDPVVLRYQRAQELLSSLADGSADLPNLPDSTPGTAGVLSARNPYDGRLFGWGDWAPGYGRARDRYVR